RDSEPGKQTFRIAVGHNHGVKPGNIVGAIANEIGMDGKLIGRIEIYDDYTLLDLPNDIPQDLFDHLKSVRVAGQQLQIEADNGSGAPAPASAPAKAERPARAPDARMPAARLPDASDFEDRPAPDARMPAAKPPRADKADKGAKGPVLPMEAYRIEVGHTHGVKPANIVGAIANEAEIEARHIGRIDIYDDYSLIDLPTGMPKELLNQLKKVWVSGQQLRMSLADPAAVAARPPALAKKPGKAKGEFDKADGKPPRKGK
ncbi:MAG TPA: DbpA RNA binding domain-containing protein, partial [Burkholderiaceae bacterium]